MSPGALSDLFIGFETKETFNARFPLRRVNTAIFEKVDCCIFFVH
jgi:hypothetical protein